MGFLEGKRALIIGVASNRSIAWGIAQAMKREGAELAFTYQNEKLQARVEKFAAECGSNLIMPCDVGNDIEIDAVFQHLKKVSVLPTKSALTASRRLPRQAVP